jgi:hypothetical protein
LPLRTLALLAWMASVPVSVFAQAAIAGSVTEPSGSAVEGVLVEASSPALIEKTRSALSDVDGRYRIEDLRPGVYSVRFTRAGWSPVERTSIELTGSFTAKVDAVLLPALTDTVTVTSAAPVIDPYSARREVTLSNDLARAIPTVRSYNAVLPLIPGVVTTSNDVATGTATTSFPIHGGRVNEGHLLLDGLDVGSAPTGNSATSYVVDIGTAAEVTFAAADVSGEMETAGLAMNLVPKAGGNAIHGSAFASGSGAGLQSDNLTMMLRDQGVNAPTPLMDVYDVSGTLGGPILTDRVWYFLNAHTGGSKRNVPGISYNLNAGDPAKWLYAPDRSQPEYSDRTFENANGRITWQVSPRNKVGVFWDAQVLCRACTGATNGNADPARASPEAIGILGRPLHVTQATWSSPLKEGLLVDASFAGLFLGVGNFERQPHPTRDLIRVAEQCASGCVDNGNVPGLVYRSQDFSSAYTGSYQWKGSIAHVTGAHSIKAGYQHVLMTDDRTWMTNDQNLTYRVNNGVPNQLTESISPWVNNARVGWDAVFAQGHWTRNRLTLQGAIRFDRAESWFPEQQEGPSRFLPTPIVIPETRGVDSYKDISPRIGVAYDPFGTGRTALRFQLGRYLEGAGTIGNYANSNPTLRMPQTTSPNGTAGVTRSWTDANGNFVPDCDLLNPAAQDLRASDGDLCGVVSDVNFGRNVLTNNFAAGVLDGWGVRPSDWDVGAAIQRQIGSRVSIDVAYTRRSFHGFFAVDNLAIGPGDLTPFSVTAPLDPRLPGGGGYVISGLYDVVPEKAGQVNNLIANASQYGNWSQIFNGIDVNLQVRTHSGFTLMAGTSSGQTVADNCDVRAHLPELSTATTGTSAFGAGLITSAVTPVSPYCRVAYSVQTQLRGLSSYVVPRVGVQLSAAFQSKPGAMLSADYAVPNAAVVPSLGRNLSANAANVTVNLIAPGTMYGDRVNQLDVRIGKIVSIGKTQTLLAVDAYNALNSSAVLTYNPTFVPGGAWLRPNSVLTPRFIRLTVEMTF